VSFGYFAVSAKCKRQPFVTVGSLLAAGFADPVRCRLGAILEDSAAPCADFLYLCFLSTLFGHRIFLVRDLHGNLKVIFTLLESPDLPDGRRDGKYSDVVAVRVSWKNKESRSISIISQG